MAQEIIEKEVSGELLRKGKAPKYSKEYCSLLIDTLVEGKSIDCFCVLVGVTKTTVYNWRKKYPEFEYSFELAECAYRSYFAQKMRGAALGELKGYDHKLLNTLYNHIVVGTTPGNRSSGPNIQVNIDNTPKDITTIANLSAEERQLRIAELTDKLIEQKQNESHSSAISANSRVNN